VTLSAALTATAVAQNTASAAATAVLTKTTVQTVLPATKSAAVTASPAVQALADEFIRAMNRVRFKIAAVVLLGLAVFDRRACSGRISPGRCHRARRNGQHQRTGELRRAAVALGTAIDEQVAAVAFSPDGKRLVTAGGRQSFPGQFQIWDIAGKKNVATFREIPSVRALAFSPDGQSIARRCQRRDQAARPSTTAWSAPPWTPIRMASIAAFSKDGTTR